MNVWHTTSGAIGGAGGGVGEGRLTASVTGVLSAGVVLLELYS